MIQRLIDAQYFGTACVSRASEIQARMVLSVSNIILKERREIILKNKALLKEFMEKYKDIFEWQEPNAGAITFVKFKGPHPADALGICLAEVGISIKPAYCFADEVTKELQQYFRVGFGEKKMPLALEALGKYVHAHQEIWNDCVASKRS